MKPLTPRQRELIRLMIEGGELRTLFINCIVIKKDGTEVVVHNRTVGSLVYRGLISNEGKPFDQKNWYSLTEEGKKVEI